MPVMTNADLDDRARTAAIAFTRRLVENWQEALGPELLGAYLIGSLAHAGFSRRYSDIDIALVTAAGLPSQTLDRLRSDAIALSADLGSKVSVFWTDRYFSLGRFPPLDRIDYLDHAVALVEREPVRPARSTLDEVRQYLCGAPFANWADLARRFAGAETLSSRRTTKPTSARSFIRRAFATAGAPD
jgi:predicted nucleotidyltransferase